MREYIFNLISELEEWSLTPTSPFERKNFELNSYVSIVAGIVTKNDDKSDLVGFADFVDLLLDMGVEAKSIKGVTLAVACCEVVNKGDLGKAVCEGLVVEQGKVISRSGEKFSLVRENSGYFHWRNKEDDILYCNLEYALSVILYSSVLYSHFIETILMIFFKSFISSESDLHKIKLRLDKVRGRVDGFRKRTIH